MGRSAGAGRPTEQLLSGEPSSGPVTSTDRRPIAAPAQLGRAARPRRDRRRPRRAGRPGGRQVAAAVLGTRQTPVVAIGSAFIDRIPPWLKDLAISLFGTNDKLALKIGILIVLLALAALGGLSPYCRYVAGAAVVMSWRASPSSRPRPGRTPARPGSSRPSSPVSSHCWYSGCSPAASPDYCRTRATA